MAKRILKKVFFSLITIVVVIAFNFFLFRIMPGDVSTILAKSTTSEAVKQQLIQKAGLDKSLPEQFLIYFGDLCRGDLGEAFNSYDGKQNVLAIIGGRIPNTVILLLGAELVAITLGLLIGVVGAWKRGKALDTGLLSASLVLYSMPTFWFAMVLIFIFCVGLHWFPTGGITTAGTAYTGWMYVMDYARHMVLPMLCMGFVMVGAYSITMRSTMIDVLTEDYITTARAKGFSEKYVLLKHAMPNAMLPMITIVALNLSSTLGGAIQLETLFSWQGMGKLMYDALLKRDYPMLQGCFVVSTVAVILANLITDILYEFIDPRVKG